MTPRLLALLLPLLLPLALGTAAAPARSQTLQVVALPTRPGVQQRVLVEVPRGGPTAPTLVLLMGGNGQLGIYPNGSLQRDGHLLARLRGLLAAHGHATVLVDAPSDRRDLSPEFRSGPEHAADLGAVVAHARQAFGRPVWLVGHSRGTQSAVSAATRLAGDAAPDGLVLAASILDTSRLGGGSAPPVQDAGVDALRLQVLLLHHRQDGCGVSPASRLPELQARLAAAPVRAITYEGGTPRGPGCDVQAFHSFAGLEQQVADDLSAATAAAK